VTDPIKQLKSFIVRNHGLKRRIKQMRYAGLRGMSWALGPGIDPSVRILGYHTIGDGETDLSVSVAQFRQQVEWLTRQRYQMLTIREWQRRVMDGQRLSPRTVVLTFDDGFRSVLTRAAPILAEHGAAGTVFALTDYMGQTNAFDRPFGAPELPLLSWDEIERLKRMGWDIQSHGRRHYPMVRLRTGVLEDELGGSKALLERRLGDPVGFFCYPYGAFDRAAVRAVTRAGYVGAVSCWTGRLPCSLSGCRTPRRRGSSASAADDVPVDWLRLPRTLIDGLMPPADFAALFMPGYLRLSGLDRWWREQSGRHLECPFDELEALRELGVFELEPQPQLELVGTGGAAR
jgi:peptidoglycan/xylan/chitin deacetylase (PgdA/CDA1 family)